MDFLLGQFHMKEEIEGEELPLPPHQHHRDDNDHDDGDGDPIYSMVLSVLLSLCSAALIAEH